MTTPAEAAETSATGAPAQNGTVISRSEPEVDLQAAMVDDGPADDTDDYVAV